MMLLTVKSGLSYPGQPRVHNNAHFVPRPRRESTATHISQVGTGDRHWPSGK